MLKIIALWISFVLNNALADDPIYRLPQRELKPERVARIVEVKDTEWNMSLLKLPEAWKNTRGAGVTVAVLDTGIDANHPDLKTRVLKEKNFTRSQHVTDRQGHGTHVAGVIAATGDLPGVARQASLINAKVLGDDGSGSTKWIDGIDWATVEGADVISMSLGGPSPDPYIPKAMERAEAKGVIVIVAAGNDGPGENTDGYPARYPQSVAIAACDARRNVADFSSRGKSVFCTAPGVAVRSTWPGGQYATLSGTSMATPHIAGLAALWIASNPQIPKTERPAKFREALRQSCNYPNERNTYRGYGLPDATKLTVKSEKDQGEIYFNIGFNDLSATKQAELRKAGITSFQLTLGSQPISPELKIPVNPWPWPKCPGGICPKR